MKHTKRKFWFDNEKVVMKELGLDPVPGSGSGLQKEDGENDYVLCQLKSTDAASISIKKLDIERLIYHADDIRKIPLFVIQFMDSSLPLLALTPIDQLGNISEYINYGQTEIQSNNIYVEETKQLEVKRIRSTKKGSKNVLEQLNKVQYKKKVNK